MNSRPGLHQTQKQTLSQHLLRGADLLELTNAGLRDFLAEAARQNPFLRLAVSHGSRGGAGGGGGSDTPALQDLILADHRPSLHSHVLGQIGLHLTDPQRLRLALAFADALEPSGWLGQPVAMIAATAGAPLHEALAVLTILQGFEPTGIFARSLCECLRLQAIERDELSKDMAAVLDHLHLLDKGRAADIAQATGLTPLTVDQCLARIRRMNPKPGADFSMDDGPLREPNLMVRRDAGGWAVRLNRSTAPILRLRDLPAMPPDRKQPEPPDLRQARSEARWLHNMIARRNDTLLAVAGAIVRHQPDYLAVGAAQLRPMRLSDIAEAVGLHESTVSRVVKGLLMETPQGVVAVRALFTGGLSTSVFGARQDRGGGAGSDGTPTGTPTGASVIAVRERIRALIATEDRAAPLSDAAIAAALATEGIVIARRTVAKFRSDAGLAPAAARKPKGSSAAAT